MGIFMAACLALNRVGWVEADIAAADALQLE
jgi:hypothetical protein